jgi:anti-sigma B factor antagonist
MIHETRVGEVLIVHPTQPRLDAHEAESFKDHMGQRIRAGHVQLVLDLSQVEFIDSSGLGAIVASLKMLGGTGSLRLCGIRETILSLFKLTRMDRVFPIFATQEEALASLST